MKRIVIDMTMMGPVELELVKDVVTFAKPPNNLDFLAVERYIGVILEHIKTHEGDGVTFFIREDWQSFAIVQGVSRVFADPIVMLCRNYGERVDMTQFYKKEVVASTTPERQQPELLNQANKT